MLFSKDQNLQEIIVAELAKDSLSTLELLEIVEKKGYSKQGFYKALKGLIQGQVIIKKKKNLVLHPTWLEAMAGFLNTVEESHASKLDQELRTLEDGDTMSFSFKSLHHLNNVWGHYFYLFSLYTDSEIIIYNSHNFWYLLGEDIEPAIYEWAKNHNKKLYLVTKNKTPLDRLIAEEISKKFDVEHAFVEKTNIPDHFHPTIFGDYIITTILEPGITDEIDVLFNEYNRNIPALNKRLAEIMGGVGRARIKIEKNHKKAEKLRGKFLNHFIFYKKPLIHIM